MTLVQLRHFVSLAQTASFSKSAQAMHLTQSAFSRSVRALEDELGMPLFDRVGRRNELTPFGCEVLDRARLLVWEAEALRERSLDALVVDARALRPAPDLEVTQVREMRARFGLVTLRQRTEAPALPILRRLMEALMPG